MVKQLYVHEGLSAGVGASLALLLYLALVAGLFALDIRAGVIGIIIHGLWSLGLSVGFAALVEKLHLRGAEVVIGGVAAGLISVLTLTYLVLPVMNGLNMITVFGWPVFIVGNLLSGLIIGIWLKDYPHDTSAPSHLKHEHAHALHS